MSSDDTYQNETKQAGLGEFSTDDTSIPSTRLIELETLLRQRDVQNEQLTIEVATLRRFLAKQTSLSTSEQVTLPPPLLSLLLPFLAERSSSEYAPSGGNSVTVALTQRAKLLQEENDELFNLLKHSEIGRLKEEVRGLHRAIRKMESALRGSHMIINSLSTDLEKCYEALSRTSDLHPSSARSQAYSENSGSTRGHGNSYPTASAANLSNVKPIPTGPRAQKRPRLSQTSLSPQQVSRTLPSAQSNSESPRRHHTPLPTNSRQSAPSSKMDVGGVSRSRKRMSPDRVERHRDRGRDREWDRERDEHERERERERLRDRERDREGERTGGRRNGNGRDRDRDRDRRGPRVNPNLNTYGNSSRGLAERMGL